MKLFRQLRSLFHREQLDADMAEEMRAHLEEQTQANLAAGMTPEEARQAARRSFGGAEQIKEVVREQRAGAWVDGGVRDFRYAVRRLARSPGFTTIALVTLALGIGVNASIFSMLNALQWRTPYPDDARLVRLLRTTSSPSSITISAGNFLDVRAQAATFERLAAVTWVDYSLAEPGHPAERLRGLNVTADFFPLLGIAPELGRVFTAEEDRLGSDVVILSHEAWQRLCGGDPAVLGRRLRMSGETVTVIGIMPERFAWVNFWAQIDVWRPLALGPTADRGRNYLNAIGRLKPGVTLAQAAGEVSAIGARLAVDFPRLNAGTGLRLLPLARSVQDPVSARVTWFTMALAVCVLAIACVNLANLQFARHAARIREQAVRAALGASCRQLMTAVLLESLLLSLSGGALGLLVALAGNRLLGEYLAVDSVRGVPIPLDWRVLIFAFLTAGTTGFAFGLLPAWFAARPDVQDALRQGARGVTAGRAQHRLRHGLIVVEVALALVLLSSAGFFLQGLGEFRGRDRGWRAENLLTGYLALPAAQYPDNAALLAFYGRLQTRLTALPGIEHAALSVTLPFYWFGGSQPFVVEGREPPASGSELRRDVGAVAPEFFGTLGIALVDGRNFLPADREGPAHIIVSESMAAALWPGESAIGRRIRHPDQKEWQEVIGVVRDVRYATNVENPAPIYQTYRLLTREPSRSLALSLRSSQAPASLIEPVRRVVAELDPDLPLLNLRPAEETIALNLGNFSLGGWLLAGFAGLGLLLAGLGLYGVISGQVVQRTAEIGIRMALGAPVRDVIRLVLGQGLRLALLGAGFGLVGTWVVARVLRAAVPSLPPPGFGVAAGLLLLLLFVSALACWLPARRAAKIDPIAALRTE